jgi:alkylation response protein AidB-like acyl-CoA dehydrogenase
LDFDLSSNESGFRDRVRAVIGERISPEYPEWREKNTTPRRMFEIFGEERMLGFGYGPDGIMEQIPWLENVHLYSELAQFSGGLGIAAFVQAQLGNQAMFLYGNEEQKREYLPEGIDGKRIFAFANTEPSAGSDASAIRSRAEKIDDRYLINGMKSYITNGDIADDIIFTAVTDPEAEKKHRGISMFVVPGDTKGLTRTRMKKYGWKESHLCTLNFENVEVPEENVVGGPGRGFYQTMEIFNNGRIGIAALAYGSSLGAYKVAYRHAGRRKAFGKPLFEHESKRNEFSEKAAVLQAGWLLVKMAAHMRDRGREYRHYSSLAKLFTTEEGMKISMWAAVTFGARGAIHRNPVAEFPHDSFVSLIGEGAPEVQKKIISQHIDEILKNL